MSRTSPHDVSPDAQAIQANIALAGRRAPQYPQSFSHFVFVSYGEVESETKVMVESKGDIHSDSVCVLC